MKKEFIPAIAGAAVCYLPFVFAGIVQLSQDAGKYSIRALLAGIPVSMFCGLLLHWLQKGRRWMRQHRPGDWAVIAAVGSALAIVLGIAALIIMLFVCAIGSAMGDLNF